MSATPGPEYLVNQSTHTCLAVLRGGSAHDAVVGLAKCSGALSQQWYLVGGQWQWGKDRSLCLDMDNSKRTLVLRPCDRSKAQWRLDEEDRMICGESALDVPWKMPRREVILYPKHNYVNQKWWTLSGLKAAVGGPSVEIRTLPQCVQDICLKEDHQHANQVTKLTCHCHSEDITLEYLISQSTNTCLSVISGNSSSDAVIGLADYDGSSSQQWWVVGGQWQWGGDRSYCLFPDWTTRTLTLGHSKNSYALWSFDENGLFGIDNFVLDVPWETPRSHVILYPKHGGVNQKWWTVSLLSMLLETPGNVNKIPQAVLKVHQRESSRHHSHLTQQRKVKKICNCKVKPAIQAACGSSHPGGNYEYLISQSTNTCLSVVNGSNPSDAVIGLADYSGNSSQQWWVVGGQWQWGGDRSYCLVPDWTTRTLALGHSKNSDALWSFDENGLFGIDNCVLDVPWETPRTRILLYPKHGGVNQKWWKFSSLKASLKCLKYPFNCVETDVYKQEVARGILNQLSLSDGPLPHPRDLGFQGCCVPPSAPRTSCCLTLDLTVLGQAENLRMTTPEDWQATGIYVPAGDVFRVKLPESLSESRAAQISVRVGAQCDKLSPSSANVKSEKKFNRCPVVSDEFELEPGVNTFRSQYGGNLIFMFDEGENFTTTVEVDDIVEAPYFILGKTSSREWSKMRELDVPYSVMEGQSVVVVAPTKSVRKLSDPSELLQRYDNIVQMLESLSGFSPEDPPPRGKQWLVEDVQISAGSAHAGFPAMFDNKYYDMTSFATPHDWVTWHELGHNYQQKAHWSYTYGCESTVNLFSCFIQEQLGAGNRLKKENRYEKAAAAVDKGLTFDAADCWEKLIFLMEIKNAFPNPGWDMYRTLNRSVRNLPERQANILSSNRQNQFDYVYKKLSRAVRADLIAHYQRWGINITPEAQKEIQQEGFRKAPADLSGR